MNDSRTRCHPLFALPLLAALTTATSLAAEDDRLNRHPVQQVWVHDVAPATVISYTNAGYRITDLEIASVSPFHVTAALVKNTGAYAKRWYWYYNMTGADVTTKINTLGVRIYDLEPYVVNGSLRFAALFEDNRGSNAKSWWWYYGVQFSDLQTAYQNNGARIIDLNRYTIGSTTAYAAVMIRNSGSDALSWSWALNYSGSNVIARLQSLGHQLYDIEKVGDDRYNMISVNNGQSLSTWFNVTPSYAETLRRNGNYRMIDVEPYSDGRLTIVMMRNSGFFTAQGSSCAPGFSHSATGNPAPGQNVQYRLNAPSSFAGVATLLFGAQATSIDLSPIGASGCRLYLQPQIVLGVAGFGTTNVQMQLPTTNSLIGQGLFTQFAVPQPGLNNLGLGTTNRLETTVGPVQ
ncbi:MAG: hypothetical protein R3F56_21700 [Planctomycetota bacterium]